MSWSHVAGSRMMVIKMPKMSPDCAELFDLVEQLELQYWARFWEAAHIEYHLMMHVYLIDSIYR